MNMEALAPFVAGPASAVFVMLLVLVGLWKLVVDKLIPLMSAALNRHLEALDKLVETNQADHQADHLVDQRTEHGCARTEHQDGHIIQHSPHQRAGRKCLRTPVIIV